MIIDKDNFAYAMMCLGANAEIAVDTETSGLNVRNKVDYLMGFCFSVEGFACYMPFRHKEKNLPLHYLDHITPLLETKDLIWHHRKFDYHSVKTIGIDPLKFSGKQYDTMMFAHMLDEEGYSKELDYLAKKHLKEEKYRKDEVKKYGQLYGFANIPVEMYEKYGPTDAVLTRRLKDYFWPQMVNEGQDKVWWETEEPFTVLLYQLEQRGVGTNEELAMQKTSTGRSRMATIERELSLNPASPIDLKRLLLDELGLPVLGHTDSCEECKKGRSVFDHEGKASFNKKVMEQYDDILSNSKNITAKRIAEFRGWQKAVSSLYIPLVEKTGPDGFIRTEYKQHGTVTRRLSSHDPNLQQIPRATHKPWNGDAKRCFWSGRPGYSLVGWDYNQLEFRFGAAYGQERLLLTEFENPKADPFSILAPRIYGILTPEFRQETKTFVYANMYGAGLRKISLQLGRPVSEVKDLYQNYHNTIPGIMAVAEQVSTLMQQRGWIQYWDGSRRHIRTKSKAYKAWNSLCQGGGAQLVKRAMLRCQEFEDDDCFMVGQVHDEITFCIRTDLIPKYEPLIVRAMTDWTGIFDFGVNFAVEGKEWGKAA